MNSHALQLRLAFVTLEIRWHWPAGKRLRAFCWKFFVLSSGIAASRRRPVAYWIFNDDVFCACAIFKENPVPQFGD